MYIYIVSRQRVNVEEDHENSMKKKKPGEEYTEQEEKRTIRISVNFYVVEIPILNNISSQHKT